MFFRNDSDCDSDPDVELRLYNVHVEEELDAPQQKQSIFLDYKSKAHRTQNRTPTLSKANDGLKNIKTKIQNFEWKISEKQIVTFVPGKREKAIDIAGKDKNEYSQQVFDIVGHKVKTSTSKQFSNKATTLPNILNLETKCHNVLKVRINKNGRKYNS